jgi:methyl-accepting chemotaxis protein
MRKNLPVAGKQYELRHDMAELRRALQQMNVNVQTIIRDVRTNIETITIGSDEIAIGTMGLFDGIGFQTNLLVLNAAVEAAQEMDNSTFLVEPCAIDPAPAF